MSILALAAPAKAAMHHSIGGLIYYSLGEMGTDGFEGATFRIDMVFPDNAVPESVSPDMLVNPESYFATYIPLSATLTITNSVGSENDGIFDVNTAPKVVNPRLVLRKFLVPSSVRRDNISYWMELEPAGVLDDPWVMNFAVVFEPGSLTDTSLFQYGPGDYFHAGGGLSIIGQYSDYGMTNGTASAVPEPGSAMTALIGAAVLRRRPRRRPK